MLQVGRWEPSYQADLQRSSFEMLQVTVNVLQVKADLQRFRASGRPALLNALQVNGPESPALRILLQVIEVLLQ